MPAAGLQLLILTPFRGLSIDEYRLIAFFAIARNTAQRRRRLTGSA